MTDSLALSLEITGSQTATESIKAVETAIQELVADLKAANEKIAGIGKAYASAFDGVAAGAKEMAASTTATIERMRASIVGDLDGLRTSIKSPFEGLAASATTAADEAVASMGKLDTAIGGTMAQVRALAAEMRGISVPAVGTPTPTGRNANLRAAASRGGRGAMHAVMRAGTEGFEAVSALAPISITPATAVLGIAAGAGYERLTQAHALAKLIESGLRPEDLGLSRGQLSSKIQHGASATGESYEEVAGAYAASSRILQGVDPKTRLGLIESLLRPAEYESQIKGIPLEGAMTSMLELSHQMGEYSPDGIKKLANQFAIASLSSKDSLEDLTRTSAYFLPQLHSSLGFDFASGMSLMVAGKNAGLSSTKAGSNLRAFEEGLFSKDGRGSKAHNDALKRLGLTGDDGKPLWQVAGADGKTDWTASNLRAGELAEKALSGLDDTTKVNLMREAFGEQGGRFGALLTQHAFREKVSGIKAQIDGKSDGDLLGQYQAEDPMQEFRKSWADLKNVLADLGTVVLPPVTIALEGLDKGLQGIHATFEAFRNLLGGDGNPDLKQGHEDFQQQRQRFMHGLRKDTAYIDNGVFGDQDGDTMGSRIVATILAQQALTLDSLQKAIAGPSLTALQSTEKAITGPAIEALQAIHADLDSMVAAIGGSAGGMGGNGFGGITETSFEDSGFGGLPDFKGAGFGGPPGKWWTPDRQAHAADRLMEEAGFSQAGAEAMVSRWANVESPSGPTSINPKSGALGIGQWLGSRKHGFTADFDSQISHAINEFNGTHKAAGDVLRHAKDHREGAIGASMFEKAEGYNPRTGIDRFTARTYAGAGRVHSDIAGSVPSGHGGASQHHGDVHVHVHGVTDPKAVAHAVTAHMEQEYRRRTHDVDFDIS